MFRYLGKFLQQTRRPPARQVLSISILIIIDWKNDNKYDLKSGFIEIVTCTVVCRQISKSEARIQLILLSILVLIIDYLWQDNTIVHIITEAWLSRSGSFIL